MTFRFYAQLNDFLPPPQRGRRFTHRLRAPASVKDVIEALGVPLSEVDVILVDGESVDFTHRLRTRARAGEAARRKPEAR